MSQAYIIRHWIYRNRLWLIIVVGRCFNNVTAQLECCQSSLSLHFPPCLSYLPWLHHPLDHIVPLPATVNSRCLVLHCCTITLVVHHLEDLNTKSRFSQKLPRKSQFVPVRPPQGSVELLFCAGVQLSLLMKVLSGSECICVTNGEELEL